MGSFQPDTQAGLPATVCFGQTLRLFKNRANLNRQDWSRIVMCRESR